MILVKNRSPVFIILLTTLSVILSHMSSCERFCHLAKGDVDFCR